MQNAKPAIENVENGIGLMLSNDTARTDVIHYSSVPWINFTDLKHALTFNSENSEPKISTGKCYPDGDRYMMAVSVTVHHALMDGLHVSLFYDKLNELIIKE